MSSHAGPVVIGIFLQEKEAVPKELKVSKHQVARILTFYLRKASPGAYSTYKMQY
jgi:sRNA-binding protein